MKNLWEPKMYRVIKLINEIPNLNWSRCDALSVQTAINPFDRTRIRQHSYKKASFLPRDAMQARPTPSCGVCLCVCVCPSVSVKTNKHIFIFKRLLR